MTEEGFPFSIEIGNQSLKDVFPNIYVATIDPFISVADA